MNIQYLLASVHCSFRPQLRGNSITDNTLYRNLQIFYSYSTNFQASTDFEKSWQIINFSLY